MATANPLPFPAQPDSAATDFKPWQHTVIDLLTQGASIVEAMGHVGYTTCAFYKACDRNKEFKRRAHQARELYRTETAEGFHTAEAYARALIDATMRDERLPASLRLRAALAILNRKSDRWLPSPIPFPQDTANTIDNVDTMDNVRYFVNLDGENTPEMDSDTDTGAPAASRETPLEGPTGASMETVDNVDKVDTMDNVDTVDNLDKTEPAASDEEEEEIDPDLVYCLGSREMAASFMELLRQTASQSQSGRTEASAQPGVPLPAPQTKANSCGIGE